eukprot:Skav227505  [mRNA]  locus=scaffold282:238687:240099:+ [translate_table: standard]
MATIFAINKHTNIPRAYDVPAFIDLNANPDLDPYVISDKSHIIGSLMENQTKKDMLELFEKFGIPLRGTSKKSKEELATIIANKLTEGLVPNEEPSQPSGFITLDSKEAIARFSAMILTESLTGGGDQEVVKNFIQSCIDQGADKEEWLRSDGCALELIEASREVSEGFMTAQYDQLLEKQAKAEASNQPEDEPASSKDEVGKFKNVALNNLDDHPYKVKINVIGSEKSFVFGFSASTHFSEMFQSLIDLGVNVGDQQNEPEFVLKNSGGGTSSAMGHEIVSNWTSSGGSFDLVPLLQGGGKKGIKQQKQKKVFIASVDVKKKAVELAKSVMPSTRTTIGELAELEKSVNQFWADADINCITAIENRIKELDKAGMENLQRAISTDAGGDTEFKLRQMSYIIFGKPIVNVKKLHEDLEKTISACELAVKSVFMKGQDDGGEMSMKKLRAMTQTYLDRQIGASELRADMEL